MWRIKFKIPPSDYVREVDCHGLETEKMVKSFYAKSNPHWKIITVTHLSEINDSNSGAQWKKSRCARIS